MMRPYLTSHARVGLPAFVALLLLGGAPVHSERGQTEQSTQPVLIQAADITYAGSFLVPVEANLRFDHSGHGLTFDPQRNSLFISNYANRVSEITIPTPGSGNTIDSLPRASQVQGPTDVLRGGLKKVGNMIGGLLVDGANLIVSAYLLYDATSSGVESHFKVSTDFADTAVIGPIQVRPNRAGFVGGPMAHIPDAWQPVIGYPALTGLCCVSIITRSSYGPAATAFDPADIVADATRITGTPLVQYPARHHTLGDWDSSDTLFNNATDMAGMVWVEQTNSVLYFGRYGSQYCYGAGAACGDPTSRFKGDHAYPYDYFVWAYDAAELARVADGKRNPWEVEPYATWTFDLPMATAGRMLRGAAYDPATQTIYLAEQKLENGSTVVIRVLNVKLAGTPLRD